MFGQIQGGMRELRMASEAAQDSGKNLGLYSQHPRSNMSEPCINFHKFIVGSGYKVITVSPCIYVVWT